MPDVICCDIDGTLADLTHRLHHIRLREGSRVKLPNLRAGEVIKLEDEFVTVRLDDGTEIKTPKDCVKLKKRWNLFFDGASLDNLNEDVALVVEAMSKYMDMPVFLTSGRPERIRQVTKDWMAHRGICYDALLLRQDGDHRPDYEVKQDMLNMILGQGYQPFCAFDDRDQVVKMWRDNGIRCFQVGYGNF